LQWRLVPRDLAERRIELRGLSHKTHPPMGIGSCEQAGIGAEKKAA
jgi:hypothetical protein